MSSSLRQQLATAFPGARPELGIRGALRALHPFYLANPDALPLERHSLRRMLRPRPVPQTSTLSDMPRNLSARWSDKLNGITHDADSWYISQREDLWRIPVSWRLDRELPDEDQWARHGIRHTHMPQALKNDKFNHYGDMDFHEGRLYVPVEGNRRPAIALVDPGSLRVLSMAEINEQKEAPWCAVNPLNGLLYSSNFNDVSSLYVYERHLAGDNLQLTLRGSFRLSREDGSAPRLDRIQGGAFSANGHLYLLSDNREDVTRAGIYVFDMVSGRKRTRIHVDYKPDVFKINDGLLEELEGITLWDLDDGRAPGVGGQIHIQMINGETIPPDKAYGKHYRVSPPEEL